VTSSSWTTSAATKVKPCGHSSAQLAPSSSFCFLPKYSPDLNPIEQFFAKLKHLLRKAAARTVEAVSAAIGEILEAFTLDECANYFENSGYAST
jgi:transposase